MMQKVPSFSAAIPSAKSEQIISINLSLLRYQEAVDRVIELGKSNRPSYACFSNVHMSIEAHNSPEFRKVVNQATYTFADGMPLIFALRLLYGIRQERIAGMDFMADVLRACEVRELSVLLFGSTPETLNSLQSYIAKANPAVKLAGMISPPFRALSDEENTAIIEQINSSGAHIVFVGLGCPKQEIWMAKNSSKIRACLLGVGGAFGLYAGNAKRAPMWMRDVGLEWLFRLGQEPKRLIKRYAVTNSKFVYLFFKQFILIRLLRRMI